LEHSDVVDQLTFSVAVSPASTSINGNVSGIDLNLDRDSLSLISNWLDKAHFLSLQSGPAADYRGSIDDSSLKLVAQHIQRSPIFSSRGRRQLSTFISLTRLSSAFSSVILL
jgi:hypothetical protein